MKKIKLLGVIVVILLIGLIGLSANRNNTEIPVSSGDKVVVDLSKENVDEVINSGGSIVEYDGYVYYLNVTRTSGDVFKNKICRRKLSENSIEEVIYNGRSYRIADRFLIFNNNLFFSIAGNTLFINLQDTGIIKDYNSGVLYSIQNEKLVYAYQGKIYRGEYYPKTLAINSTSAIATANPTFMFEDADNLYFYSINKDNSKTVFSINKERQDLKILERVNLGNLKSLNIIDYIQSDKNIYVAYEKKNKDSTIEYEIRKIAKDSSKINNITINEDFGEFVAASNENVYYTDLSYNKLYEYTSKENSIIEADITKTDFYVLRQNEKNIDLYKNTNKITNVISNTNFNFSNAEINEIGDYIYIKFDLINAEDLLEEFMFFRVRKDGSNLERLN